LNPFGLFVFGAVLMMWARVWDRRPGHQTDHPRSGGELAFDRFFKSVGPVAVLASAAWAVARLLFA
jgi:hypothetical protein